MKLYLAGPLFTLAERNFNIELAGILHEFECLIPQVFCQGLPLDEIAKKCIFELRRADVVLVNCDGPDVDSGTAFEAGYAVRHHTPIIGYRTDFRKAGDDNSERSVNLMIGQYATHFVQADFPPHSVDEFACELKISIGKIFGPSAGPKRVGEED